MRGKRSIWLMLALSSILLFWPSLATSVVKSGYKKIIEIAFANGYVEAITLEEEEIRKLKNDKELLKASVREAAKAYLNKVAEMND